MTGIAAASSGWRSAESGLFESSVPSVFCRMLIERYSYALPGSSDVIESVVPMVTLPPPPGVPGSVGVVSVVVVVVVEEDVVDEVDGFGLLVQPARAAPESVRTARRVKSRFMAERFPNQRAAARGCIFS